MNMDRNLALSLVIGATVGSSMRTAVGSTISEVGRLGSAVRNAEKGKADALKETAKVERTQQQLQAYRALGREVLTAGRAHRDAQEKVKALAREIGASAEPTKAQEKALEAARKAVVRAAAAEEAKKQRLAALRAELKAANVDTTKLADAERKLAANLASAKAKADDTTRSIGRLGDAMNRVAKQREIGAELGKTLGTVGAAYMALRQSVKEAGDFEHQLRAFGNTANMTAGELAGVRKQIRAMSSDVLQSNDALLSGVEVLVGKGMDAREALRAVKDIGRAATATGASMDDMANLSFSVMSNLHVPVDQLGKALNIMAAAGKEGGFELKNMAQQFPQLTAAAASLGLTGTEAVSSLGAALQVAMKGASDPSTAANNLANFLGKIASPETVRNFEKLGIDIKQALADGAASGENPMETVMRQIAEATGADLDKAMADAFDGNGKMVEGAADRISERFKLGELFGDKQVQDFLAPMLAGYQDYLKIKQKAAGATGVVDKDFANMAGTFNKASERLGLAWSNIKEGVGASLLPVLTPLTNTIAVAAEGVADLTEKFPVLTGAVVTLGGGYLALRTTTLATRYSMTFLRGGLRAVVGETVTAGWTSGTAAAGIGRLGAATGATSGRLGATIARLRQYTAAANAAAGASGRLANAQSGIGGLGDVGGIGKGLGGAGRLGKALRFGGKALGTAGLVVNAGFAAKDLMDPTLSREDKGASVGNLAGGMAGAAAGAAIGSFVPVVGTAIGAIIGGALGAFGGEKLGALVGRGGVGQAVGGAMAATAVAMPAMAGSGVPPPQAPPAIERAEPERNLPAAATTYNTFHITIQAQPGQDTKAIGEEVRRQLEAHFQQIAVRRRGSLSDVD